MQTITPNNLISRVLSFNKFFVVGVLPIGSFIGGLLFEKIGLKETLLITSIGLSICILMIIFSPIIKEKNIIDIEKIQ